jgi:nucleoside-diphosphate-sugar epimerase
MRVLVTGASGYTGSRLVAALLADGHGVRVVVGDMTKPAILAGIAARLDIIYHLAGTLAGGPAHMHRVTVEGTRNLIDQCRFAGAGRTLRAVVFAGNAAVYGDGRGVPLTERSPCRLRLTLGCLSLMAEELLRQASAECNLAATGCHPRPRAAFLELAAGATSSRDRIGAQLQQPDSRSRPD